MDIKEKIISQSLLLFINRGVRSVNMDEVSSNLGISKKTLYLYVNNKSDLVFQTFSLQCENLKTTFSSICNKDKNAIDELYEMDEMIILLFKSMHVSLISELKKRYLETWEVIEDFKTNFLFNLIEANIKKGIRQNLYRQNLNSHVMSKIFINRCESLVDGQLYTDLNIDLRDILKEHRTYHVRGIASLKGTQHLEEKLEIW
ncbi:TetR/AcrR family transcriptional regulator [Flavobacteriales bacterium]|nr:TetR/AcrR family transcriptional regulator [Flavobacteriales bacterium]